MATILVVDDKDMMRDSLSLALARAGHKAVTTGDPSEAVGLVRQHRPACVITDLKMPKMSGLDVLKWICEHPECSLIPVIVLTSSREERDIVEAYRLGANSYVVKPSNFDDWQQMIRATFEFWGRWCEAPKLADKC